MFLKIKKEASILYYLLDSYLSLPSKDVLLFSYYLNLGWPCVCFSCHPPKKKYKLPIIPSSRNLSFFVPYLLRFYSIFTEMCLSPYDIEHIFFQVGEYYIYCFICFLNLSLFLHITRFWKHFPLYYICLNMIISKNFTVFHVIVSWFIELMSLLLYIYSVCSNKIQNKI